ncbi:hypothetical protein I79_021515 [Cricetulus griseus]|uniref:Uncharacterized protein n=1 Tax=Cricetulus griseus TaxID=10029 RepID=G3ICW2_CRIGR|nr:hypothetical protein I79_021515 [Cricetulus griseus]
MALGGAARLSRESPTRRRELGAKPALAAATRDPRAADAGHSDQRAPQTALPSYQEVAAPRRPLIGCGGEPGGASEVQPAPSAGTRLSSVGEEPHDGHSPRPCLVGTEKQVESCTVRGSGSLGTLVRPVPRPCRGGLEPASKILRRRDFQGQL